MAKLANVSLLNTFNTWRIRTNDTLDRLNAFAVNKSTLYANTIIANNVLRATGNSVLGVAGKQTIINGRLTANGTLTVGTNLTVSGNTTLARALIGSYATFGSTNAVFQTSGAEPLLRLSNLGAGHALFLTSNTGDALLSSGNIRLNGAYSLRLNTNGRIGWDASGGVFLRNSTTEAITISTLGAAPVNIATQGIIRLQVAQTGLVTANNSLTVAKNFSVTGNTTFGTGSANTFVNFNGSRLTNFSEFANTAINAGASKTIPNNSNVVRYTLNQNTTLTLPTTQPGAAPAVKTVVLFLKQNGTGGYSVTLAAPAGESIIHNNSGTQPAVNTTANKVTIFTCVKFDGDSNWYVSQSFIDA